MLAASSTARATPSASRFAATLLASGTGTLLGLLAAVSGGWFDAVLSRVLDTLISIPSKMFALRRWSPASAPRSRC